MASAVPKLELIDNSDLMRVNLNQYGASTIKNLDKLPDSIQNKLSAAKEVLAGESHIISSATYPTVYITSDIHADLRKFIQLLISAGMIEYTDAATKAITDKIMTVVLIPNAVMTDFNWIAPNGTLLIIIGDLVDGHRSSSSFMSEVTDTIGNIELLLHIFLYNLRIKAREKGSEVRFTIGNHDMSTVLNNKNDGVFDDYVHKKAKDFFYKNLLSNAFKNRRQCLLPFYECCPYLFLTLDTEIICIHGGLRDRSEKTLDFQSDLDEIQNLLQNGNDLNETINNQKYQTLNKSTSPPLRNPFWTRYYSEQPSATVCLPSSIGVFNKKSYSFVVVGHCPTDSKPANPIDRQHPDEILKT